MEKLIVSSSPHLQGGKTTQTIMLDVIIALLPALAAPVLLSGPPAGVSILPCVATCILSEYLCRKAMKRPQTVGDLSCVVTGILLALNLPVTISPFIAVFGGVVAIVVVKQMFGGIGMNFVNPALTARIVLMSSFPTQMSTWSEPFYYLKGSADAITTASPLNVMANGGELPSLGALFVGFRAGCLGETCAVALLLGGVYLALRRVIRIEIPLCFIGTVFVFSWILGQNPVEHILTGGLLLGAIFMATDYTTSPITFSGRIIFGIGCGLLTVLIRAFGSLPEGVSFSIIIMNILVPHIERLTRPKPFGEEAKHEKA